MSHEKLIAQKAAETRADWESWGSQTGVLNPGDECVVEVTIKRKPPVVAVEVKDPVLQNHLPGRIRGRGTTILEAADWQRLLNLPNQPDWKYWKQFQAMVKGQFDNGNRPTHYDFPMYYVFANLYLQRLGFPLFRFWVAVKSGRSQDSQTQLFKLFENQPATP